MSQQLIGKIRAAIAQEIRRQNAAPGVADPLEMLSF